MFRNIAMIGVIAGVSASVPIFLEMNPGTFERSPSVAANDPAEPDQKPTAQVTKISKPAPAPTTETLLGRKVLVRADPRGHFVTDFKFNGRRIQAMVDTGATAVAINQSTARRVGLSLTSADFKYEVQTANGKAKAAAATLARIEIGRISIENIEAVVLEDKALSGVLVGMSFLSRLSKFQVQDGALVMQQ